MPLSQTEAIKNIQTRGGEWLILADAQGYGKKLAERLVLLGQKPIFVTSDAVLAGGPDAVRNLPAEKFPGAKPACRGIIHLWSLDSREPEKLDAVKMIPFDALAPGVRLRTPVRQGDRQSLPIASR